MKVALLGAFGLVGKTLRKLLEQDRRVHTLMLVGSKPRSLSKQSTDKKIQYSLLEDLKNLEDYDVIFSSLDSTISAPWYLKHRESIACFIDKGSYFRMHDEVPLVVPELTTLSLAKSALIASPNCVAIELSLALFPLKKIFCPESLIITTLQSISGTGQRALDEFLENSVVSTVYPFPLNDTVLGICGTFLGEKTDEEEKIEKETAKILGLPLKATVTAMRVPITRGHHLSVSLLLKEPGWTLASIQELLERHPRLRVLKRGNYPKKEDLLDSEIVFISRLRLEEKRLTFLISADNLYVGAAYNAWKIFERYFQEKTGSFAKVASQA